MLIRFNLAKRINLISIFSIIIFVIGTIFIAYYYADFSIKEIDISLNLKRYTISFIENMKVVITIIDIIFCSVLSLLELKENNRGYDAFFIVKSNKFKFFTAKLVSYFIMITFFLVLIFIGVISIYLIRFKNVYFLRCFLVLFLKFIVYSYIIFLESLILIILTNNVFITLFPILFYWASLIEINDKIDSIIGYLFPHIIFDLDTISFFFTGTRFYEYSYLFMLVIFSYLSYLNTEIKC